MTINRVVGLHTNPLQYEKMLKDIEGITNGYIIMDQNEDFSFTNFKIEKGVGSIRGIWLRFNNNDNLDSLICNHCLHHILFRVLIQKNSDHQQNREAQAMGEGRNEQVTPYSLFPALYL